MPNDDQQWPKMTDRDVDDEFWCYDDRGEDDDDDSAIMMRVHIMFVGDGGDDDDNDDDDNNEWRHNENGDEDEDDGHGDDGYGFGHGKNDHEKLKEWTWRLSGRLAHSEIEWDAQENVKDLESGPHLCGQHICREPSKHNQIWSSWRLHRPSIFWVLSPLGATDMRCVLKQDNSTMFCHHMSCWQS